METTFNQRFAVNASPITSDVFPQTARNGLLYIIEKLIIKGVIQNNNDSQDGWAVIYREMLRTSKSEFEVLDPKTITTGVITEKLKSLKWNEVYIFCERIYKNLLSASSYYDNFNEIITVELKTAENEFERELNNLINEENLPFVFENGNFLRPGKIQTQKNINRSASVLVRPELEKVRKHFNKAQNYFSNPDNPDYPNSIKEALCSLELAAEILSRIKISKDFSKEILKLSGMENDKIPPPIINAMVKIFAYRGNGEGVAHGMSEGLRVSPLEAELVLSVVAAFITYLVCFFENKEETLPF